jgi:hypothetical protein
MVPSKVKGIALSKGIKGRARVPERAKQSANKRMKDSKKEKPERMQHECKTLRRHRMM